MLSVLAILVFACILSIIIGLVKPGAVIRWGKPEKRGRGKVVLYYGVALIILMFAIGNTSEDPEPAQQISSNVASDLTETETETSDKAGIEQTAETSTNNNQEAETAEPATRQEKTKAEVKQERQLARSKEAEEKRLHPEWNASEPDAMENGNIALAIDMLLAMQEMPAGELAVAQEVIKTPWNFYGMPVLFTGVIAIAEDYPPDSDTGKAGVASDIVMESEDGTIIEFFSMVPSGALQAGDAVSITGYPVGRTEVENAMGGSYTHLIVVTNSL